MRNWKKGIKSFGRKQARGNASKKSVCRDNSNLYRLGAGNKGRKYHGNSNKTHRSCPCHPPIKFRHIRRKMNNSINKKEIKAGVSTCNTT